MVFGEDDDDDDCAADDGEYEGNQRNPYGGLMGGEIRNPYGDFIGCGGLMGGEIVPHDDDGDLLIEGGNIYAGVAPESWQEIQGVLMQKGQKEDAKLPEKIHRKMFDSVLAGYEALIVSATQSGDQHRFKLIGQLAIQAENLRRMSAKSVKEFEQHNGAGVMYGQNVGAIGVNPGGGIRLNREENADLIRNVIDLAHPLLEMAKEKYFSEARVSKASELNVLVDTLAKYKPYTTSGDGVLESLEERIKRLTKEMANDLVPTELLRGRDTDGGERGKGNTDQVGPSDTDGARGDAQTVGVRGEEVEGDFPDGGGAGTEGSSSLDDRRRGDHHPGTDREGVEEALGRSTAWAQTG